MLTFEELHGALVLLRCGSATKSAEITATADLWINLSRVQAVLPRLQLANHVSTSRPTAGYLQQVEGRVTFSEGSSWARHDEEEEEEEEEERELVAAAL